MTDSIGQDNVVPVCIEQLSGTEQFARKFLTNKLRSASCCAVHDENGILNDPVCIAFWLSQRAIVYTELWKRLSVSETEILDDEIAFCRGGDSYVIAD